MFHNASTLNLRKQITTTLYTKTVSIKERRIGEVREKEKELVIIKTVLCIRVNGRMTSETDVETKCLLMGTRYQVIG